MSFKKSKGTRKRHVDKTGFTSYDDVFAIIKDNVGDVEFYQIEPAIVLNLLLDPKDFPRIKGPNDKSIPDYSFYGTIKARFVESQKEGDEITGYIKPLSPHIVAYPIIGEAVNVAVHGGQLYYYNPLNLRNKVNMNLAGGQDGDGKVTEGATEFNRPLHSEHGDVTLNGRYGNGIKIGSDPSYQYPDIKITNRQAVLPTQVIDDYASHPQGINTDGSSIFMTSGPIRKEDHIIPAAFSLSTPDVLDGDMVTINSDKLVFNAKGDVGEKGNNGDIHMFARENCNLVANNEINLELGAGRFGRITFGDPESINPILKGNQTEDLFQNIISSLDNFCDSVSSATDVAGVATAAGTMLTEMKAVKKDILPQIKSDFAFIGENFTDEIIEEIVVASDGRGGDDGTVRTTRIGTGQRYYQDDAEVEFDEDM